MSKAYIGGLVVAVTAQLSIGATAQNLTGQNISPATEAAEFSNAARQEYLIDNSTRMTVPVRINGSDPVPFIVDTGSERTIIAHELAQSLALEAGPPLVLATVGGREEVGSFLIDNLDMATIKVADLEAPALARQNLGAFGLIGIDSLEDHKLLLDFRGGRMDVLKSKKGRSKTKVEDGMIIVTAKRKAGRMILSSAKIDGRKIDIILDTGAQTSIANTAMRKKLRSSNRGALHPVTMRSVTGDVITGDLTQIRDIEISGLSINNLPIIMTDNNYVFDVLGLNERPAILLGMDAMKLFDRVVIDFTNRRVGFELPRQGGLNTGSYRLADALSPAKAMH